MNLKRELVFCVIFNLIGTALAWGAENSKAVAALQAIAEAKAQTKSAKTVSSRAAAWLKLQRASESFAGSFLYVDASCDDSRPENNEKKCPEWPYVARARSMGVTISYCGAGESLMTDSTGYEKYLELMPTGSDADVAWWHSKTEPPCCDECVYPRSDYEEFLKHFPKSRFAAQAKRRLQK